MHIHREVEVQPNLVPLGVFRRSTLHEVTMAFIEILLQEPLYR
jgi:hypothetical protein